MQTSLFDNDSSRDAVETIDLGDASAQFFPHAFAASEADSLQQTLAAEIPWRQDDIRMMGRVLPVPRLQCWMGDPGCHYGYSGIRLEPEPWHPVVLAIKDRIQQLSGKEFNAVLLNQYRQGNDSVSWHADDEPELGPAPEIASVSFGVTRRFDLKHKRDTSQPRQRLLLTHGSLLIMDGGVQQNWLHQVPKERRITDPRINLTFRKLFPAG